MLKIVLTKIRLRVKGPVNYPFTGPAILITRPTAQPITIFRFRSNGNPVVMITHVQYGLRNQFAMIKSITKINPEAYRLQGIRCHDCTGMRKLGILSLKSEV